MAKKRAASARRATARSSEIPVERSQLNARADPIDFRDLMFVPTLVEVPQTLTLDDYRQHFPRRRVPILNQGREGACTGFGLAAVAHYLLHRRTVVPDRTPVSPRMFYEMARRYDEWPGEDYSGSSARGAVKGWHKHGVCSETLWPYRQNTAGVLTHERAKDAASRPLGAYFRVNHRDLVSMHAALAEVGVLYATSTVHAGWSEIDPRTGVIPGPDGKEVLGGHAFAIVGYDQRGFWIQNSWGEGWGMGGFALITYVDWLANSTDVWVTRLGAPVEMPAAGLVSLTASHALSRADYSFTDVRPHVIGIGNNGALRPTGEIGTKPEDLDTIFTHDFPRVTAEWGAKRLLLYAHGGLVSESNAIQRVAEYRKPLLEAGVYPLAFIWKTDFWTTLTNILKDAMNRRRPEGFLDSAKDFMLDRLDDTLEVLTRLPGQAVWGEMKENALLATTSAAGGARLMLDRLAQLLLTHPDVEVHVAGHSAGSIFMAPVLAELARAGIPIRTCTLWAPACTMKLFKETYLPAIQSGAIERFALFTLKDGAERDDHCANIYHKSLLYWVSNAFEDRSRVPLFRDGEPILGMEKFVLEDPVFAVDRATVQKENPPCLPILGTANAVWVRSPNGLPEGSPVASNARHHGDFDDDKATVKATLARILDVAAPQPVTTKALRFSASATHLADCRHRLQKALV